MNDPGEAKGDEEPILDERFFLVLGAQKCGTTWLYRLLDTHPDAWVPPIKELHYFDSPHFDWAGSRHRRRVMRRYVDSLRMETAESSVIPVLQWMASAAFPERLRDSDYVYLMATGKAARAYGEFSPSYASLPPEGFDHMRRVAPNARWLYVMRDPVDRIWSHLRMNAGHSDMPELLTEDGAREAVVPGSDFLDFTDYGHAIDQIERCSRTDQRLFLFHEDLIADPDAYVGEVLAFLGLDRVPQLDPVISQRVFVGSEVELPEGLERFLREQTRPIVQAVERRLGSVPASWR